MDALSGFSSKQSINSASEQPFLLIIFIRRNPYTREAWKLWSSVKRSLWIRGVDGFEEGKKLAILKTFSQKILSVTKWKISIASAFPTFSNMKRMKFSLPIIIPTLILDWTPSLMKLFLFLQNMSLIECSAKP